MATRNLISRLAGRLRRKPRFEITRNSELEPFEVAAENEFALAIENNLEDYVNSYWRKFGKTINTDEAKKFYKPYAKTKKGLTRYSRAVYAPAKALANELFRRALQSDFVEHVIFMGGGTASGKSSGIGVASQLFDQADLILDGTLASLPIVRRQVTSALKRDLLVDVVYIHCRLEVAIRRAVYRADKLGRSLSLDVMAGTHYHSQKSLIALYDEFGGNPAFGAMVIDNSEDYGSAQPFAIGNGVEYVRQYSDLDDLRRKASILFNKACDEFKQEKGRELPATIYETFLRPGRKVTVG